MPEHWIMLAEDKKLKVNPGTSLGEALKQLQPALYGQALAIRIDENVFDFSAAVPEGTNRIEPIRFDTPLGESIFRHSSAHLMAAAVKLLYPETRVAIGPSIQDGFYYDFDRPQPFTPDDLTAIENKMRELVQAKIPFSRKQIGKDEAYALFKQMGEPYKLELLDGITENWVSIYSLGEFVDLCRGPHVSHTGVLKAFKLLSVAGAYWRGDEKNKMLQRIYGTSFDKASALEAYLTRMEEAKRRDHRLLGKQLDLFSLHEEAGAGLVYWHPKGSMIRKCIEDFWRQEHIRNGYDLIYSPHIGKAHLWETSGHLQFYKDFMYAPMTIDEQDYYIKPMNCPFHIKIYKTQIRSYRQMPIRWAELGTVYRYEKSGVLHGLFRVRGFTQDDAHIFCTEEQVESEVETVVKFILAILKTFGFDEFEVYLSTQPAKDTVGSDDVWQHATLALQHALEACHLSYQRDEGGGAFYGPKIDIKIKDSLGRTWQCSTVQVDFNEPERFEMRYMGADGHEHIPIMIHRALLGSLERFFGVLIEHYGGAFPVWLAPVQARICTIADRHAQYAQEMLKLFRDNDLRVDVDSRSEKINAKIRDAQLEKIPYMLVVGDHEIEGRTLAVRSRTGENRGPQSPEDIIKMMIERQASKDREI